MRGARTCFVLSSVDHPEGVSGETVHGMVTGELANSVVSQCYDLPWQKETEQIM